MASDKYDSGLCELRHREVSNKLDRMVNWIWGNGKPGADTRLAKIEQVVPDLVETHKRMLVIYPVAIFIQTIAMSIFVAVLVKHFSK